MSFNVSKSNVIAFGRNSLPCQYKLGFVKYLGVFMTSNLKWDLHVNAVVNRATRILGLIRHTLFEAPTNIRLVAYKTLCRPLLEYASAAWDP